VTGPALVFHVSDVSVIVSANEPEALAPLELVWGNAGPILPPSRTVQGHIEVVGNEAAVHLDEARTSCERADVAPAFEQLLYDAIPSWHSMRRALVHAAAVAHDGRVLVLCGPSGCGKSSLALAMVERGARYLTDELVVFDGERLWGIPRAPQFEPVAEEAPLPARLAATDRTTYRFQDRAGNRIVLPIRRLPSSSVAAGPYPPHQVQLVFPVAGSAGEPHPVAPREALRRLLAETRGGDVDLGPLLARPATVLPWDDVSLAAHQLLRAA
jgi:hypothetical protein